MAIIACRMIGATRASGTFTRFWSYSVASTAPSRPSSRVRWASGSAARSAGTLSMLSATVRVDSPPTAAKGSARPATSTPITPATATMTPRWDSTLAGRRRSDLRGDMRTRVRDRSGSPGVAHHDPAVTHVEGVGVANGSGADDPSGLLPSGRRSHNLTVGAHSTLTGGVRRRLKGRSDESASHIELPQVPHSVSVSRGSDSLPSLLGIDSHGPLGGGPFL